MAVRKIEAALSVQIYTFHFFHSTYFLTGILTCQRITTSICMNDLMRYPHLMGHVELVSNSRVMANFIYFEQAPFNAKDNLCACKKEAKDFHFSSFFSFQILAHWSVNL